MVKYPLVVSEVRDRYFSMYQSIEFKSCYYGTHKAKANQNQLIFTIVMAVLSFVSISVWSISKSLPALWAVLIAAAQLAQALSPLLPWSKQLVALKFLLPQLTQLVLDIDREWLSLDQHEYSDEKIIDLVSEFENRYANIEAQFVGDTYFSEADSIISVAELDAKKYFYNRYPSTRDIEQREVSINAG